MRSGCTTGRCCARTLLASALAVLALGAASTANAGTVTYTGVGLHTWAVPDGVKAVGIDALGGGGGGDGSRGGAGCALATVAPIVDANVLVFVGGHGASGGAAGGGGGSTDVLFGGGALAIAGGGGGGGGKVTGDSFDGGSGCVASTAAGGNGGGLAPGAGGSGAPAAYGGHGGGALGDDTLGGLGGSGGGNGSTGGVACGGGGGGANGGSGGDCAYANGGGGAGGSYSTSSATYAPGTNGGAAASAGGDGSADLYWLEPVTSMDLLTRATTATLSWTKPAQPVGFVTYALVVDGVPHSGALGPTVRLTGLSVGTHSLMLVATTAYGLRTESTTLTFAVPIAMRGAAHRTRRAVGTTAVVSGAGSVVQVGHFGGRGTVGCRGRATAKKAGAVRLVCRYTRALRRALRRGRVTLLLTTAYTPTGGEAHAARQTIVLRRQR